MGDATAEVSDSMREAVIIILVSSPNEDDTFLHSGAGLPIPEIGDKISSGEITSEGEIDSDGFENLEVTDREFYYYTIIVTKDGQDDDEKATAVLVVLRTSKRGDS